MDEPRVKVVTLRLTEAEYARLVAVVEADDARLGPWMRRALLAGVTSAERARRRATRD